MKYSDVPQTDRFRESDGYGLVLTQQKGLLAASELAAIMAEGGVREQIKDTQVLDS